MFGYAIFGLFVDGLCIGYEIVCWMDMFIGYYWIVWYS